jgi:integrase
MEIKASFAGEKIRRFFPTEQEAYEEGERMVAVIRDKGTQGLKHEGGVTVAVATRMFAADNVGKSKSHCAKIDMLCRALNARWPGSLDAIEPLALSRWIKSKSPSTTTQAMWLRYARMFFKWAATARFLDRSPLEGARAPRVNPLRNILTAPQMKQLLSAEMPDKVRALILLGGFAGLRTEEIYKLTWEEVDVKGKQVYVPPEASKDTGGFPDHIVDMTEPLLKRLDFFKGKKGRIVTGSLEALHEARRSLALSLGWERWPKNALRHSYATYHLARCGNPGMTAFQMGHTSTEMVRRHYAVAAKRADWKAWWRI